MKISLKADKHNEDLQTCLQITASNSLRVGTNFKTPDFCLLC